MSAGRPDLAQEKMLWGIALAHFGASGLRQVVREIWSYASSPTRPLVEVLDISIVGPVVLNILLTVQAEVGATVAYRKVCPSQVALYSHHAQLLTSGLLDRLPPQHLPRDLRGFKLGLAFGL